MAKLSDFAENMKLAEDMLADLERGVGERQPKIDLVEEVLSDYEANDELTFKQRLRVKVARERLVKVLSS